MRVYHETDHRDFGQFFKKRKNNGLGHVYSVVPAKESNKLMVVFPTLRPFAREWRNKSNDYICNVIGHEGKNSLLSELVAKGLATGLMATDMSRCRDSFGELTISITLTKKGADYHKQIIKIVFDAIKKYHDKGVNQEFYKEC